MNKTKYHVNLYFVFVAILIVLLVACTPEKIEVSKTEDMIKEAYKNNDLTSFKAQITSDSVAMIEGMVSESGQVDMPDDLICSNERIEGELKLMDCVEVRGDQNFNIVYVFSLENGVWKFNMVLTKERLLSK